MCNFDWIGIKLFNDLFLDYLLSMIKASSYMYI